MFKLKILESLRKSSERPTRLLFGELNFVMTQIQISFTLSLFPPPLSIALFRYLSLAGCVAVEELGGPKIPWKPGRIDFSPKQVQIRPKTIPQNGNLPDAA